MNKLANKLASNVDKDVESVQDAMPIPRRAVLLSVLGLAASGSTFYFSTEIAKNLEGSSLIDVSGITDDITGNAVAGDR